MKVFACRLLGACALSLAAMAVAGCAGGLGAGSTTSAAVVRHKILGSSFPIASAVEIPAGATTVYLSGKVPPVIDKSKAMSDPAAFGGDTRGQTIAVLGAIESQLQGLGLQMKDVVKMQVFLVADPAKGKLMDFAGFMEGYSRYFGTPAQPNLPARSAFQIAGLTNPAWYVEIEVVAVRAAHVQGR
jgi:enamine deaminase RidA (YjgF/YER057c/UK114 family)